MSEVRGPGHTTYYEQDGIVYRRLHNDPAWTNPVAQCQTAENPLPPWQIARLLNEAFNRGKLEQQMVMRDALGIPRHTAT